MVVRPGCCHAHIAGTTDAYLDACRGLICGVHLHDNTASQDDHGIPGSGTFPWGRLLPGLKRSGYVGPLMLEFDARTRQNDLGAVLSEARSALEALTQSDRVGETRPQDGDNTDAKAKEPDE